MRGRVSKGSGVLRAGKANGPQSQLQLPGESLLSSSAGAPSLSGADTWRATCQANKAPRPRPHSAASAVSWPVKELIRNTYTRGQSADLQLARMP